MFPVSRKNALAHMWPSPDVIPPICRAIERCPDELWDSCATLDELGNRIEPLLVEYGARRFDFIWQMERHFAEPFGPLPSATLPEYAGIPEMFLVDADLSTWHAVGYVPESKRSQ